MWVRVGVVWVKICKKNIERINLIWGGSLPYDPRKKSFDFEKNHPEVTWVHVGKGGCGLDQNLGLMIRDGRTFFEWL